tara:strand:+ start:2303 stop:3361 length:1059 start_codon:yes stop_codon:yes gene_type:complete
MQKDQIFIYTGNRQRVKTSAFGVRRYIGTHSAASGAKGHNAKPRSKIQTPPSPSVDDVAPPKYLDLPEHRGEAWTQLPGLDDHERADDLKPIINAIKGGLVHKKECTEWYIRNDPRLGGLHDDRTSEYPDSLRKISASDYREKYLTYKTYGGLFDATGALRECGPDTSSWNKSIFPLPVKPPPSRTPAPKTTTKPNAIIIEQLANLYPSLRLADVGAGGDCQFQAVAAVVGGKRKDARNHRMYRNEAVTEIRQHWDRYRGLILSDDDPNTTKKTYIDAMRKVGVWGDNVTLTALATSMNVQFDIISSMGPKYRRTVGPPAREGKKVAHKYVLGFNQEQHYMATIAVSAKTHN